MERRLKPNSAYSSNFASDNVVQRWLVVGDAHGADGIEETYHPNNREKTMHQQQRPTLQPYIAKSSGYTVLYCRRALS